jgi:hypothetical protein
MSTTASARRGVLLLAPRPGTTAWAVVPVDARALEPDDAVSSPYRSAEEALRAAEQLIADQRLKDPVSEFSRYMREFMLEAEHRGENRAEVVGRLQLLLQRAAHGGDAIRADERLA